MIVIKFGGTSVGDPVNIGAAVAIVDQQRDRRPIVVVSALPGITSALIATAEAARRGDVETVRALLARIRVRHEEVALRLIQKKSDVFEAFLKQLERKISEIDTILHGIALLGEVTPRARDKVTAVGAKLSSVLFAYALMMNALPGEHIDSEDVIITDDKFCEAIALFEETRAASHRSLLPLLDRARIPVLGGYTGRTLDGASTTLGRGGSDYSATTVGAAVDAEEIQIWTGVAGLLSCDPRIVPSARVIETLSFEEAAEVTQFGTRLARRTLEPARRGKVPVRILNVHEPSSPGTLIMHAAPRTEGPRSIACTKDVAILTISSANVLSLQNFIAQVFRILADLGILVDLIATAENSLTVTIQGATDFEDLKSRLAMLAVDVDVIDRQSTIAVVGRNLLSDAEVGARILGSLHGMNVKMLAVGRSGLSFSIVLDDGDSDEAVRRIHRTLFELPHA